MNVCQGEGVGCVCVKVTVVVMSVTGSRCRMGESKVTGAAGRKVTMQLTHTM